MRSPAWLWKRENDSLEALLLAPLRVASWIHGAGARLHRASYAHGLRRARQLDCRVVSVGSPLIGGSGKTPTAAWIASALHARGHAVALATRGYGGRRGREVRILSDGTGLIGDPVEVGDEALVLCSQSPGVPVLVARDRGVAGLMAIAAFGTRVLVLDDGFAHHRLARDVDIVTLDAATGFGNGAVVPRGPLREPVAAMARAHAVGVVDGVLTREEEQYLASRLPSAYRYRATRRAVSVRPLTGGPPVNGSTLEGMEVGLLSGIARPEGFARSVSALGARVVAERAWPDHHPYRAGDLAHLAHEARIWLTTEKDAVKIMPSWVESLDLRVLRISLEVEDADGFLDWLEQRIA